MEDRITLPESKNVLKNIVKMGVSAIAYLRNLFAENVFEDATIGGLPLKRLTRVIPESAALIDWIDYGIYDALGKEYLRLLIVSIHDSNNVALESYSFSFQYHTVICNGAYTSFKEGECSVHFSVHSEECESPNISVELTTGIHKDEIKSQTIKVLRDLVLLTQSLSPLPENRFVSMKLLYYDERVPKEYEPQFFRRATCEECLPEGQISLEHNVGQLETGYHNMTVEIRSCCYFDENNTNVRTSTIKPDSQQCETPFYDPVTNNYGSLSPTNNKEDAAMPPCDKTSTQNFETEENIEDIGSYTKGEIRSTHGHQKLNMIHNPLPFEQIQTDRKKVISRLLEKAQKLAHKSKFLSKETISAGLGVDGTLSKAIVKKMMESGYIDIRYTKNKGYMSKCYNSSDSPAKIAIK